MRHDAVYTPIDTPGTNNNCLLHAVAINLTVQAVQGSEEDKKRVANLNTNCLNQLIHIIENNTHFSRITRDPIEFWHWVAEDYPQRLIIVGNAMRTLLAQRYQYLLNHPDNSSPVLATISSPDDLQQRINIITGSTELLDAQDLSVLAHAMGFAYSLSLESSKVVEQLATAEQAMPMIQLRFANAHYSAIAVWKPLPEMNQASEKLPSRDPSFDSDSTSSGLSLLAEPIEEPVTGEDDADSVAGSEDSKPITGEAECTAAYADTASFSLLRLRPSSSTNTNFQGAINGITATVEPLSHGDSDNYCIKLNKSCDNTPLGVVIRTSSTSAISDSESSLLSSAPRKKAKASHVHMKSKARTEEEAVRNIAYAAYIEHYHYAKESKKLSDEEIQRQGLVVRLKQEQLKTSLPLDKIIAIFKSAGFSEVKCYRNTPTMAAATAPEHPSPSADIDAAPVSSSERTSSLAESAPLLSQPTNEIVTEKNDTDLLSRTAGIFQRLLGKRRRQRENPDNAEELVDFSQPFDGFNKVRAFVGGANEKGEHAGVYQRVSDNQEVFIKRDSHGNKPRAHKVIAEAVAGRIIQNLVRPNSAAKTSLVTVQDDCRSPESAANNLYLVSEKVEGYVLDLWQFAYVHQLKEKILALAKNQNIDLGDAETNPEQWYQKAYQFAQQKGLVAKTRPRRYGSDKTLRAIVNNALEFIKDQLGPEIFNQEMAQLLAPSLFLQDFDRHIGNVGVAWQDGQFHLVQLDYGGALRQLSDQVKPEALRLPVSKNLLNLERSSVHQTTQPTNHLKEYPRRYRITSEMAAQLELIATNDPAIYVKEAIVELKAYDKTSLENFYLWISGSKMTASDEAEAIEKIEAFLIERLQQRQYGLQRYAFEIRATLLALQSPINEMALTNFCNLYRNRIIQNLVTNEWTLHFGSDLKLHEATKNKNALISQLKQQLGFDFDFNNPKDLGQLQTIYQVLNEHIESRQPWALAWQQRMVSFRQKQQQGIFSGLCQLLLEAERPRNKKATKQQLSLVFTKAYDALVLDELTTSPWSAVNVEKLNEYATQLAILFPASSPDHPWIDFLQREENPSQPELSPYQQIPAQFDLETAKRETQIDFSSRLTEAERALLAIVFQQEDQQHSEYDPILNRWSVKPWSIVADDSRTVLYLGVMYSVTFRQNISCDGLNVYHVDFRAPESDSIGLQYSHRATLGAGFFGKVRLTNLRFQWSQNRLEEVLHNTLAKHMIASEQEAAHAREMAAKAWGEDRVGPLQPAKVRNINGELRDGFMFTMPLQPGESLKSYIEKNSDLLTIGKLEIAKAILKAYRRQVIDKGIASHGDLGARNMMIARLEYWQYESEIAVNFIDWDRGFLPSDLSEDNLNTVHHLLGAGHPFGLHTKDYILDFLIYRNDISPEMFRRNDIQALKAVILHVLTGINFESLRACIVTTQMHVFSDLEAISDTYVLSPQQFNAFYTKCNAEKASAATDGYSDVVSRLNYATCLLDENRHALNRIWNDPVLYQLLQSLDQCQSLEELEKFVQLRENSLDEHMDFSDEECNAPLFE